MTRNAKLVTVATLTLALGALGVAALSDPASARPLWIERGALAQPGFGQLQFRAADGHVLTAEIYRASRFDPVGGPVWFVMHGASRAAERYVHAAAPVAERYDALAIVVHFTKEHYPKGSDYTRGHLHAEIERLFDAVRETLDGAQQGYHLFGHSAGAQFTHVLLTFLPDNRVLRAVAANAGWYTLPVFGNSPSVRMPYGLADSGLGAGHQRSLFSADLTVLLGERDTATPRDDRLLRGSAGAMAQGSTRLERGRHYFATAEAQAAALGMEFAWRLAHAPRAGHDAAQVIDSAGFFTFVDDATPCTASTAVEAAGLMISELLADPPDGPAGDANGDGERDPHADEFVEIVNRGATPICLTGWTLGDAADPERHVFPISRALAPGSALVVFGGGVPTGRFGEAEVQWAERRLSLSNEGDVVTLRDANETIVRRLSWGDCDGAPCAEDHLPFALGIEGSVARSIETDSEWAKHRDLAAIPFSPGTGVDGSAWQAR